MTKYGLIGVMAVDPESAMRNRACVVSAATSTSSSIGTSTGAAIDHIADPLDDAERQGCGNAAC